MAEHPYFGSNLFWQQKGYNCNNLVLGNQLWVGWTSGRKLNLKKFKLDFLLISIGISAFVSKGNTFKPIYLKKKVKKSISF